MAKKNKIAFFEVQTREKKLIKKAAKKLGADIYKGEVENLLSKAKKYEVISCFIYSDLSKKILKQLPNLKLIATRSTGTDHIDLDYCQENKIKVANVPDYGQNTVAEQTFALILALSRRIIEANDRVRQGGFTPHGLTGFDLKDKTIGIVGVGKIGQHVVKIAKGFDMKVIGVARHPDKKLAQKLGFKYLAFEECLKQSDILTFHVPLTRSTFHMLNRKNILDMKKGSLVINTARGPIVESEALLIGLEKNILAGAGLDVLEEEETLDDAQKLFDSYLSKEDLQELVTAHLLREKTNVVITPHNAFNTREAIGRIVKKTVRNIEGVTRNK